MTDPFVPLPSLSDRVHEWLRGLTTDDDIYRLLSVSFGRVVINRKIENFTILANEVEAGRRWFARAIELKLDWLDRLDEMGRPKKLMKFSNIPGIVKEIRKSQVKEAQRFATITISDSDEEFFAELEGGFHLVKLKTKQALLREGGALQNCLGDGDYDEHLASDRFTYLVLRDSRSRSHAVAEVRTSDNLVWDIRGKQNALPKVKYLAPLASFITERGWPLINRWDAGFVIDDVGRVHYVDSKPGKLSLRGELKIYGCKNVVLPTDLSVTGFLSILGSNIAEPAEFIKAGVVVIERSTGSRLAHHVVVRNSFEIKADADFAALADALVVDGPLQMKNNEFVKQMPSHLRISDWLQANGTQFERFGDDTQILGCVDVTEAKSHGGFTFDADRMVVHPGDMVEIIGGVQGVNRRIHGDLKGKFGALAFVIGSDGGVVDYPGDTGIDSVPLLGSAFRKVLNARLEHGGAYTDSGDIVVDFSSLGIGPPAINESLLVVGEFNFDAIEEFDFDSVDWGAENP